MNFMIGMLFLIKGLYDLFKGVNYFLFKESFIFIAMEVIAVKELSWKYTTLIYEYHYQSKNRDVKIKCKSYESSYKRFNFIYGNEQYICFSAIKGLGLMGVGLRIFMLCL